MFDNIINKNIMFLQNHGIKMNGEDDKTIYKYGLQILYFYITDLIVIFSFSYIFFGLYETAIMIFIFGLLQIFGGGYHAETPLKCLVTMIIGVITGNLYIIFVSDKILLNLILTVFFSGVIFILNPASSNRHQVSQKIKRRSKLIIKFIVILTSIFVLILGYFNRNIEIATITVTLGLYLLNRLNLKRKNAKNNA